jgi:outer membrane lipoprotein-sorting protein
MSIHDHVLQVLSAMLDGDVDPELRGLAEDHLQRCSRCQRALGDLARVDALAREVLLPSDPAPFEAALAERLAAEQATPAPPVPDGQVPVLPRGAAPVPAGRPTARPPARPRRPRPRRPWARRAGLAALAALVLAVALAVASVVPGSLGPGERSARGPSPSSPPPTTLAPQQISLAAVLVRAERAVREIRTLRGAFTWSGPDLSQELKGTYRFVYASPDRLRIQGPPRALFTLRINDGLKARRVWALRDDPRPALWKGTPLVRPQDEDALGPLATSFSAPTWFRGRLEDPDRPAKVRQRNGREVYVLVLERERDALGIPGVGAPLITHLEVWVDTSTYLPVRIQYQDRSKPGRIVVRQQVRYSYDFKHVNDPVPAEEFAVPPGAEVREDLGFRTMPLEAAIARASYPVPRVGKLPQPGWTLLRAGYAPTGSPTGSEAGNPAGHDLVVAVYGSGLERFVVTTVLVGDREVGRVGAYGDPFGAEGAVRASRRYRLRRGAFAGTVATIGLPSDDTPYLWLRNTGGVVVTLRGATTVDQLIAAAESLTR